ncbi:MAG: xanthine permease [Erysipelotrichaceae bacterium]|nr:xanthine permease [Erysipelotrichaceae bacterium]
MTQKTNSQRFESYLPDQTPPLGRLLLYAIQQVIVMFPATITVALITKFPVSTTIFASGLATVVFTVLTKGKLPMYYGSSFAYLSAVLSLACAELGCTAEELPIVLPVEVIGKAQFGIVLSGFVSIFAGLLVRKLGNEILQKFLPPVVTGSVAAAIGLSLASNAVSDFGIKTQNWSYILVAVVTLVTVVLSTRYLKGFIGQLSLLIGTLAGCLVAAVLHFTGIDTNLFRAIADEAVKGLATFGPLTVPLFNLPIPNTAALSIIPIALATIPESSAHTIQLDAIIKNATGEETGIKDMLDKDLIGDGICDMVSGFVGGPAGTNYGENISVMAITKVFSTKVMVVAGIMAMIISFFKPLIGVIYGIPLAVIGGLEVYLFGAIAVQGIMMLKDVNWGAKEIAIASIVLIVGMVDIGLAAILGLTLSFVLSFGSKD